MLNALQFKRLVKIGDYVRVYMNGKITINGFLKSSVMMNNPHDHFRLDWNGIETGNIMFDDIYEFEIYRKVTVKNFP